MASWEVEVSLIRTVELFVRAIQASSVRGEGPSLVRLTVSWRGSGSTITDRPPRFPLDVAVVNVLYVVTIPRLLKVQIVLIEIVFHPTIDSSAAHHRFHRLAVLLEGALQRSECLRGGNLKGGLAEPFPALFVLV